MLRHPTPPLADVIVPRDAWLKLFSGGLEDINNPKEVWEVAVEAIDEWARRHNPSAFRQMTLSGYQWKHLFLPPGTLLRTVFRGKNYHCLVDEDNLMYEGKPISPNGFVNAVGGIRRNAWRSIWVLYPKTTGWKLADTLRTRTRSRPTRARKVPDKPVQASVPTPPPDTADRTSPVQRPQGEPQLAQPMPEFPAAAPPHIHDAGNAGAPGASIELRGSAEPVVAPGGTTHSAEDGRTESTLARVLLAELLAFLQRLRGLPPHAERGGDAVGSRPSYGFSASNYVMPHIQMAAPG